MKNRLKIIKKTCSKYNEQNYRRIIVFTKGFKAIGEVFKDSTIKELLTLKDVKVYLYATNCECELTPEYKTVDWLNIFSKDIIAFSFIE